MSSEQQDDLKGWEIAMIVVTAVFFDALQWLFAFIFMDWAVSLFAGSTIYLWFKLKGMNFMRPKRFLTMGGSLILELIPILSILPAWTLAVVVLIGDMKIKKAVSALGGNNVIGLNKEREKRRGKGQVQQGGGDERREAA